MKEVYFSPSKVNLFFRVLGKRSDGYHEVASLIQAIDFGDYLSIQPSSRDQLSCSSGEVPCDERNLIWKALMLFRSHYAFPHVHVHLEKRVPMQAGLGGGSSNGATALWAFNAQASCPASVEQLFSMGEQLGSDVPFFFSSGTAYCTGRGERCREIAIPPLSGWIVKPHFGLPTGDVYRGVRLEDTSLIDPEQALLHFQEGRGVFCNDLEPAATRLNSELSRYKGELVARGFPIVSMTGSGSAFFCPIERPEKVPEGVFAQFVHSINRQPSSWY